MNASFIPELAEVTKQRVLVNPQALHAHFLALLPRIETHARIRFHYLRCPGRRDDAVAEVVAVCWRWYLRLVQQGKDIDKFVMVFADYAVRHVRSGRTLCGQEKAKDVMSSLAQHRRGFDLESLACSAGRSHETLHADPHGQEHMDAMEDRLRDNTQSPVPDQAAFRIDYPAWLSRLEPRNREITKDMAMDYPTKELAARHKVSPGRISQLRREFQADYKRFHGELTCI